MAAKNYARFLPAAVESVLAQTFADWELLIIDDGSTDHTPAAVRPFLADPRVRYFRSDRLGQPRAKNLGIGLSRGEFVAFLDADDAWQPTKLEKQLALFRDKPEVGVVFCRRSLIDEAGRPAARRGRRRPAAGPRAGRRCSCRTSSASRRWWCGGRCSTTSAGSTRSGTWPSTTTCGCGSPGTTEFDFVDEELVLYRTGHGNLSKKLADRVATAMSIMHRAVSAAGWRTSCRAS